MKTNKTIVRIAALSALVTLGACQTSTVVQPPLTAHDPWETYKLGTVYDCDQVHLSDMRHNPQTLPTEDFGCAHQSNITLMASNPQDLHTPRAMTPADPRRIQRVYDAYGAGEDTTTAKRAEGTQQLIQ